MFKWDVDRVSLFSVIMKKGNIRKCYRDQVLLNLRKHTECRAETLQPLMKFAFEIGEQSAYAY